VYTNFPTFEHLRSVHVTLRECWHNKLELGDEHFKNLRTGVMTGSACVEDVTLAKSN
ncbi:hypothetical protein FRB94_006714, partial [Tulasnella sp. JGI-2019a]